MVSLGNNRWQWCLGMWNQVNEKKSWTNVMSCQCCDCIIEFWLTPVIISCKFATLLMSACWYVPHQQVSREISQHHSFLELLSFGVEHWMIPLKSPMKNKRYLQSTLMKCWTWFKYGDTLEIVCTIILHKCCTCWLG